MTRILLWYIDKGLLLQEDVRSEVPMPSKRRFLQQLRVMQLGRRNKCINGIESMFGIGLLYYSIAVTTLMTIAKPIATLSGSSGAT